VAIGSASQTKAADDFPDAATRSERHQAGMQRNVPRSAASSGTCRNTVSVKTNTVSVKANTVPVKTNTVSVKTNTVFVRMYSTPLY
jgi:phage baseplate assembly protein gpV